MTYVVTLTKSQLRDARACPSGLRAFQKIAGKGKRALSFNPDDPLTSLWVRSIHGLFVQWLERHKLVPRLAFYDARILNAELTSLTADNSQWRLVVIRDANLINASFTASSFTSCSIFTSDLFDSRFYNATFITCGFTGVILTKARFDHALFQRTNFTTINFKDASFYNAVFTGCCFTNCNFNDSNFKYAIFRDCNFRDCNFNGAHLGGAILNNNSLLHGALRFKDDPQLHGYRTKKHKPDPDYVVLESRSMKPTK